ALVGTDNAGVERGRARHRELALEGPNEIARLHDLAVGELDALPDVEQVGLPAIGRRRDRRREVGNDRGARRPADPLELNEHAVGTANRTRLYCARVVRLLSTPAEGCVRQDVFRPAGLALLLIRVAVAGRRPQTAPRGSYQCQRGDARHSGQSLRTTGKPTPR